MRKNGQSPAIGCKKDNSYLTKFKYNETKGNWENKSTQLLGKVSITLFQKIHCFFVRFGLF